MTNSNMPIKHFLYKNKKISVNLLLYEKLRYDNSIIYMESLNVKLNGLKANYVKKNYKPATNILL